VKGAAGNMSICKIYSSADQMEKAIRKRDPAVPALLIAFRSLLNHQVHAIRQTLDAQMRAELLNKVAAPIANKMFECGLIP